MCASAVYCLADSKAAAAELELVMTQGEIIRATTATGTIEISAGKGLLRSYTWNGATRSAKLVPRTKRWYGSLGAYYPGPGEHWKDHEGITRGVLQEGQQHFRTSDEAQEWIKQQSGYYPTVYRNDGLLVSFGKILKRHQVNVEVWQILINGEKPSKLAGGTDTKVEQLKSVSTPQAEQGGGDNSAALRASP